MGHSKLYRNFIILQEDSKYAKDKDSSKQVSGYAKLEAKGDKCKVSFYVQNLEASDKYCIMLVSYKKDNRKIINLGTLDINDLGKGEVTKEYLINNIAGLNFSFDDISGASVCKVNGESMSFILYGFINGESVKDDWKKCKIYNCDKEKENYYKESCESCDKKKKKLKDKEEKCKDKHNEDDKCKENHDDDKCKDEHHDNDKCKSEHNDDDKCFEECKQSDSNAICEDKQECTRSDIQNKFDKYEQEIEKKNNQNIDPYDFDLKGKLGDFFESVVKDFKQIKYKITEIKYCKWYKAEVKSIDDMCDTSNYNKYTIAFYPMMNYYPYIKKYGYFMIGYKCDEKGNLKYIVYGVPGTKSKDSQPYGGQTGFVTWMKTEKDDLGLWLMFYDYKKSMVVIPEK